MKKITILKTGIIAAALVLSVNVFGQGTSVIIDMESSQTSDWTLENTTSGQSAVISIETSSQTTSARSGAKYLKSTDYYSTAGIHFKYTPAYIVVPNGHYAHTIAYFGSSENSSTLKAIPCFTGDVASTPTGALIETRDITTRKNHAKQNTSGNDANMYFRYRTYGASTQAIYCDDVVIYTSSNSSTDLTAPVAPSVYVANSATSFSWSAATDDNTGVQKNVILRTSTANATAPVLLNQVDYKVNDVIGDWTVIAVENGDVVTYADAAPASTNYYAVVARDLAYNYSTALTTPSTTTSLENTSAKSFNVVGVNNSIELSALTVGNEMSIYDLTGAKVFAQTVKTSEMSVNVPKGIYIVRVANNVVKVSVR